METLGIGNWPLRRPFTTDIRIKLIVSLSEFRTEIHARLDNMAELIRTVKGFLNFDRNDELFATDAKVRGCDVKINEKSVS